jgi:hypothetical protein
MRAILDGIPTNTSDDIDGDGALHERKKETAYGKRREIRHVEGGANQENTESKEEVRAEEDEPPFHGIHSR